MSDEPSSRPPQGEDGFIDEVARKSARKLKAQREGPKGVWFGLGMSGLIGWSVALPDVLGALLGLWLDAHHPGGHSWTLMLLVIGLVIGCLNAWRWLSQQDKAMQDESEDGDE
jgi:ATP synthase protein I